MRKDRGIDSKVEPCKNADEGRMMVDDGDQSSTTARMAKQEKDRGNDCEVELLEDGEVARGERVVPHRRIHGGRGQRRLLTQLPCPHHARHEVVAQPLSKQ